MTEKRAQVPWQIVLGIVVGIAITTAAIVYACRFVDGASARITASVGVAVVVLPVTAVIASIVLFLASTWKRGGGTQD